MNIGVDLHDTLTYAPEFFAEVLRSWRGKKYIVTGTPARDFDYVAGIVRTLSKNLNFEVDDILMGYDFDKREMNVEHFRTMAKHKLTLLRTNGISVYFDDNPFYAEFLRRHGITVFQTIVSPAYLEAYRKKDPYFSCHLQERQFSFLGEL